MHLPSIPNMESPVVRVDINPDNFRWTRERAGVDANALVRRFPKYLEWESGDAQPTLKQLEKLARTVHAPVGFFFLSEPLDEPVPIPDFRTVGNAPLRCPSPDLLDTLYLCQQRQDWYREFARMEGVKPLAFVDSATLESDVETIAATIRGMIGFELDERRKLPTWSESLRHFIRAADTLGVLVMVSGIVHNNTRRKLNPAEFRGFALADELAPLIFINGADTKAAQMFTLAHELAHLWLGQSVLSNSAPDAVPTHRVEAWCNRVAAEILVPLAVLREECREGEELPDTLDRLAYHFKVSTLVILCRLHDARKLTRDRFRKAYRAELERLHRIPKSRGGNFYPTQTARVGNRFAHAIVVNTLEGHTTYRDALRLLGFSRITTFRKLANHLLPH